MGNFLRNFNFDQLSFWMGFLAGSLFWLLARMMAPALGRMQKAMAAQAKTGRGERMRASEIRLSNDMLRQAQGWHLASVLFSLDEIIVTPRLLAPPVPPEAEGGAADVDITDWAIPYTPDWPEIGSRYGAPTLSLAEALRNNANIAVIGEPGTGKSVTLAHLAVQLIRHEVGAQEFEDVIPLLVHAADLVFQSEKASDENVDLLAPLRNALALHSEAKTNSALPRLLPNLFERNVALILLDGLDEMPPAMVDAVVEYLGKLVEAYPGVRMVAAASPHYLGGLLRLDFFPLAVASWNAEQRSNFLYCWSGVWDRYIAVPAAANTESANSLMLSGWLLNNTENLTPLELTLKVWAAFAGDALGSQPRELLEAHIRRLIANQPPKNRQALERLASQMMLSMQPVADLKSVVSWVPDSGAMPTGEAKAVQEEPDAPTGDQPSKVKVSGALPGLIDSGLVINRAGDRVSIAHPTLAGYLASQALGLARAGDQVAAQPDWSGKSVVLHYLAINDSQPAYLNNMLLDETIDPLLQGVFTAGRWLRDAPEKMAWISLVMRHLAGILQKENLPMGLKARALSALVQSGNPGVIVLLRQMLQSPRQDLRQMAALGMGYLRESKAVEELAKLLEEKEPGTLQAAALALVAIGDKTSLEVIADSLLHGDDEVRRAAAEALSNHVEEGHPTLEEAATIEDPLVRRAAVFGLARINQPWSIRIIEKLREEDKQWVVQDVATQALGATERPSLRVPARLPELTMSPWLIQFAGERGMGVAPGKPAYELL